MEPIQFLGGTFRLQTTERYLACKQRIRTAVNDRIGIETESLSWVLSCGRVATNSLHDPFSLRTTEFLAAEGRADKTCC